jgi:outer membrane murein-binding lipoprotein Lpp
LEVIMQHRHFAAAVAGAALALVGCTGDRTEPEPNATEATSSRRFKEDIAYVSPAELDRLKDALVGVRLATFRYKGDKTRHLGFILEDSPDIPASDMPRSRVDLYAYTSMAVAALQIQAKQIEQLEADVDALSNEVEALTRGRQPSRPAPSSGGAASSRLSEASYP